MYSHIITHLRVTIFTLILLYFYILFYYIISFLTIPLVWLNYSDFFLYYFAYLIYGKFFMLSSLYILLYFSQKYVIVLLFE